MTRGNARPRTSHAQIFLILNGGLSQNIKAVHFVPNVKIIVDEVTILYCIQNEEKGGSGHENQRSLCISRLRRR